MGDHLGEDPRKDRCPPPKCLPRVFPMPRVPGASSHPQVPGAVLSGATPGTLLCSTHHPLQGPALCSGAVIWEKSVHYKFALSPRCQGKGGFFKSFNLFYFRPCWVFVAAWAFSGCSEQGLLLVAARRLPLQSVLSLPSVDSAASASAAVALTLSCSIACGVLPDQGSNLSPLRRWADSQPLEHEGNPEKEIYKPLFQRPWSFQVTFRGALRLSCPQTHSRHHGDVGVESPWRSQAITGHRLA